MTMDDLDQVLVIDQASFAVPWPARSYRFELMENPVASIFVAEMIRETEAEIIGYVGLWELVDEGHISTLAVAPEHRRQGVAESLLIKSLQFFVSRKVGTVSLEVRKSNRAAQSLYAKFGFEVVGTRRGYYRDNKEDAFIMTLERIPKKIMGLEVQCEPASNA
jgi:ribosomal-protein-alanine N-acetyltransferase